MTSTRGSRSIHGHDDEHRLRLRPTRHRSQRSADRPADSDVIIATLRTLLQQAGLTPPYLLVGHYSATLRRPLRAEASSQRLRHRPGGTVEPRRGDRAEPARGFIPRVIGRTNEVLDRIRGRYGLSEVDVIGDTVRQVHEEPPFPTVPPSSSHWRRRMRMVPQPAFDAHQAAQGRWVALTPIGPASPADSGHCDARPEIVPRRSGTARRYDVGVDVRDRRAGPRHRPVTRDAYPRSPTMHPMPSPPRRSPSGRSSSSTTTPRSSGSCGPTWNATASRS